MFIIVIVAITYGFSLLEPRRVFTLGVWCFSGFSSLFPLVFASLYWKRTTKAGAYACVIAAIASWLYLFKQSNFALNPQYTVDVPLAGYTYHLMPVTAMIAASTLALIVVSLITPRPTEATLEKFFQRKHEAD